MWLGFHGLSGLLALFILPCSATQVEAAHDTAGDETCGADCLRPGSKPSLLQVVRREADFAMLDEEVVISMTSELDDEEQLTAPRLVALQKVNYSSASRPANRQPPSEGVLLHHMELPRWMMIFGRRGDKVSKVMIDRVMASPPLLLAYIALLLAIACLVMVLYWHTGATVIVRILLYIGALSTIRLSVKNVYVSYKYEYPKFISALHFFCGGLAALAILHWRRSAAEGKRLPSSLKEAVSPGWTPSLQIFSLQFVPIAAGFAISVLANNMALVFCTAAFTEIISSTSPACTAVTIYLLGMPFNQDKWWPVLLVVIGCIISTTGEVNFRMWGFIFCILANFSRVGKSVLQQRLLQGETKDNCDPITLLYWMCIPSTVMMIIWSIFAEGLAPYRDFGARTHGVQLGLSTAIVLSCLNAGVVNTFGLYCTRDLGAVGTQLAGQLRSMLGVLGPVVFFNETVSKGEVFGFGCLLIGVYWYQRTPEKSVSKALLPPQPQAEPVRQATPVRQTSPSQPTESPSQPTEQADPAPQPSPPQPTEQAER